MHTPIPAMTEIAQFEPRIVPLEHRRRIVTECRKRRERKTNVETDHLAFLLERVADGMPKCPGDWRWHDQRILDVQRVIAEQAFGNADQSRLDIYQRPVEARRHFH